MRKIKRGGVALILWLLVQEVTTVFQTSTRYPMSACQTVIRLAIRHRLAMVENCSLEQSKEMISSTFRDLKIVSKIQPEK